MAELYDYSDKELNGVLQKSAELAAKQLSKREKMVSLLSIGSATVIGLVIVPKMRSLLMPYNLNWVLKFTFVILTAVAFASLVSGIILHLFYHVYMRTQMDILDEHKPMYVEDLTVSEISGNHVVLSNGKPLKKKIVGSEQLVVGDAVRLLRRDGDYFCFIKIRSDD